MRMKNNMLKMAPIVAALGFTGVPLAHAATDCTAVTEIPQVECEALVALYNSTDGPNWYDSATNNWNVTDTPCSWSGVSCNAGQVTDIDRDNNQLTGTIPPALGNLSNLTGLHLYQNQLTGTIPPELGNLSNLTSLRLYQNQLTGTIPPALENLSNLTDLDIRFNQLTGTIPPALENLSNLTTLVLNENQLTGTIPPELGNLSNLTKLDLGNNQLTGTISSALGNLSNLTTLGLYENQLTGTIPQELENLSNLTFLSLGDNQLTGTIPPALGNLSNLTNLVLHTNQLTGTIPPALGNLSNLSAIDLSCNLLTIPSDQSLIDFIDAKDASGNWKSTQDGSCSSSTPSTPTSPTDLNATVVSQTQINLSWTDNSSDETGFKIERDGSLIITTAADVTSYSDTGLSCDTTYSYSVKATNATDDSTAATVNATTQACSTSALCTAVTEIPQVECEALVDFYQSTDGSNWVRNLGWNDTNAPCAWYGVSCEDGHVTNLNLLNNGLSGAIPEPFGNLSNLKFLSLFGNQLTSLSESFGDLSSLESLTLNSNQLTSLPESFGNLSSLLNFEVSGNQLTSLPESIGNLSSLGWLFLNSNQLTSLPESIGNLSSLLELDLSNNHLCNLPLSIINLSPSDSDTDFANNHLTISDPDLIDWLNQYDNDWISSQTLGVCGNNLQANLQADPSSHDFGQLESNQQAHQLFTITNTSDETTIHINTVILTGDQAAEFTQSTDVEHQCTDKTLAPSEVCDEYITFIPNGEGEKQAQLVLNSDDPDYPEIKIDLSAIVDDSGVSQPDNVCLTESPTLQTIGSGLWGDNVWGDMDGNPVSDLPGENDVLLINEEHSIIGLPQIDISALCNKGELRSAVGEPLEIIASNGISNYGSMIGEPGQIDPETNCGTPGSDVILKAGQQFKRKDKREDWWWYGKGKPIYNGGTIKAGDGGNSEECAGKGGDALVLGRNTTNDDNATIIAGNGGNAFMGTGGGGGLAQVWGKLGGPGDLISRGQVHGGDGGDGDAQGGDGGNLWLVSWPNVYLGPDQTNTDGGVYGTTEISAHHAGVGGQGTSNGQGGDVIIEPPLIALTQGVEIKGRDITIFGGDDMTLDFSGLTDTAITATGDIILSVGESGVISFEGTTATIFKAAGNVIIRANHVLTDGGVELSDIIQANEIMTEPGQVQREVLLTGPSVLIGEPNITTTLTFILTNNGPTADVYDLTVSDTADWDLGSTLPDSVSLEGLSSVEFDVHVTPPADLGEGNLISVVATSQTDGDTVISVADVQIITGIREVPKDEKNDEKSPPTTITHSPVTVQPAGCLFVGKVFNEVCNAGGRSITHLKTVKGSNLANAVIKGTLTNNGWVSNLTITPEGHLIGGIVTGYIVNDGLMENFKFRGMSIIGGTLGGIVTNLSQVGGYIEDVHLAPDTHLIGGELRGEISGDEKAPALIEGAKINRNAVLSNIIIGEGTELEKGVTIGKGVRFADGTLIPEGLYLTDALFRDDGTIDLNRDIVTGGASLLQQINQIPEMLANGWQLEQDAETGEYYVMVRDIRIVIIPLRVRQARRGSGVQLKIHPDGVHVTLVTAQEREILVEIQVDSSS
jgi:Leucine-rich repeat (LRR) protein